MFWNKDTISAFVKKWKDEGSGEPATAASLKHIETVYNMALPKPYRDFMLKYGNISTQQLMCSVVMGEYDLPDLLMFFSVEEILERMKEYPADLQAGFLCFAPRVADGMFLFNIEQCNAAYGGDAPVWIYTQEHHQAIEINDGFVPFLGSFLDVKRFKEDVQQTAAAAADRGQ